MQLTPVSDVHVEPSSPLCPTRPCKLPALKPSPEPLTLTLNDPVDPTVTRAGALAAINANDTAIVALPNLTPAVRPTRLLPLAPCAATATTAVSDIQLLASQSVPPSIHRPV